MEEMILKYGPLVFNVLVQCGILKAIHGWIQENKRKADEEKAQKEKEELAARNAIRCILRSDIIKMCCKAEERGYIVVYEVETLTDMFNNYTILGGNGAIKELYKDAMNLPHMPHKKGDEC